MVLVMGACVCLGVAIGVGSSFLIYASETAAMSVELNQKTQRIQLFETLLHQMSKNSVNQGHESASPEEALNYSASVAADTHSQAEPRPSASLFAHSSTKPSPSQSATVNSMPIENFENLPTRQHSGPITTDSSALRKKPAWVGPSAEMGHSTPTNTAVLETIAASKVGVKFLFSTGVLMHNGRMIRIGDLFPSGERLIQVDLDNNRVVTSERHISLVFNQE